MTREGWESFVHEMTVGYEGTDLAAFEQVVSLLAEADAAKALLRLKGYGWSGLGLLDTVLHVPDARAAGPAEEPA